MAEPTLKSVTGNSLLDNLPKEDLDRIQPALKLVELTAGQVLSNQGAEIEHVYFPTTSLVSCRASGSEGETVEIYAVGHEGVVEPAAILTSVAAVTAEVQISGAAWRIRVDDLCTVIRNTTELPRALLKYAYSLAVRMVQATKCAMFHSVKQRLILWLLLANRAHGKDIPCTHQSIADALGTRRASVTMVLNALAEKGILDRHRGRITIRNRSELESNSCDCFQLIKAGLEPDLECNLVGNGPSRAG
jgi:CRP-like cAMP-binding protein